MQIRHRRRHLLMWFIIGPLILIGFALGLCARRAAPLQDDHSDGSVTEVSP